MRVEGRFYKSDGSSDDTWDDIENELDIKVQETLARGTYSHIVLVASTSINGNKFLVYRDGNRPTEFDLNELVTLEKELRYT